MKKTIRRFTQIDADAVLLSRHGGFEARTDAKSTNPAQNNGQAVIRATIEPRPPTTNRHLRVSASICG
ncbi:hypothetical protein ACS8Y6_14850 [Salinisphaera sp. RV14]|uniref:hypothetical protein n=1 Tax=Salinisphaera sp. RV14 TaxID=3454140 RepID=UPI003F8307F0